MMNHLKRTELEMEYKVDDRGLGAAVFLPFVNRIWPGGTTGTGRSLPYPKP